MSTQDQITAIERTLKEAQAHVAVGKALERLKTNREFRIVIAEGYFKEEAVRLVHLRGDSEFQTPEKQADILKQIDAISNLNQYFRTIELKDGMAEKSVEESEAMLAELRGEGI